MNVSPLRALMVIFILKTFSAKLAKPFWRYDSDEILAEDSLELILTIIMTLNSRMIAFIMSMLIYKMVY